jgi:hypothetical protein
VRHFSYQQAANMHLGERLRQRRIELGFEQSLVERAYGLSTLEFDDFEGVSGDAEIGYSVAHVRAIAEMLGLDLMSVLKDLGHVEVSTHPPLAVDINASEIISRALQSSRTSNSRLASHLGLTLESVAMLQSVESYVQTFPIRILLDLASTLAVDPVGFLVPWNCRSLYSTQSHRVSSAYIASLR